MIQRMQPETSETDLERKCPCVGFWHGAGIPAWGVAAHVKSSRTFAAYGITAG